MPLPLLIKNFKDSLKELTQGFQREIATFRGSRPTSALVEDLLVECYGGKSRLKDIASITIQLPNAIIIEPWDKSLGKAISKAISDSPLNLTPNVNGNQVKLFLPPLSKERKEELIKLIGNKKEEYRIKLKKAREEAVENIKDNFLRKEISEDDKFRFLEEIQKAVAEANSQLDEIEQRKVQEIQES